MRAMKRLSGLGSVAGLLLTVALVGGRVEGRGEEGQEMERFEVDPRGSWVVAVTEKAGALGFLGHRHAVLVTEWQAEVDWRPEEPAASRATVTVAARSLRIDTERARELAGLGAGPGADDVAELQEKMLSAENLAAADHPELRFRVTRVAGRRGGGLEVAGALTVRGKTRAVRFPVAVAPAGAAATEFTGSFTVAQTDFGIEPESIAGVIKVADPVEIRFRIVLLRE
jgi:polyisoprenoid-binding protein YceI